MKFILGKKLEMTTLFNENGKAIPVTLICAGPCKVTRIKTQEGNDKYNAIQLGFTTKKRQDFNLLREFRVNNDNINNFKNGDIITVDIFQDVKKVNVSGISKGKGFQGGVKRHGFAGGRASHGDRHVLRQIGSVGASFPERVWKGKRMPGQTGLKRITIKNLEVFKVIPEQNILAVKGAVPGHKGTILEIRQSL